ncbi:hypothetical protein ACTTBJ_20625, partial [Shewanella frigidimarina]|uniref:hypothetical protein n=1 Tax=Shewanella frigidimarina TaxID=56812 RepID=UPI003FA18A63
LLAGELSVLRIYSAIAPIVVGHYTKFYLEKDKYCQEEIMICSKGISLFLVLIKVLNELL